MTDPARARFLFGSDEPPFDPDDDDAVTAFFTDELLATGDEAGDFGVDFDDDFDLADDRDDRDDRDDHDDHDDHDDEESGVHLRAVLRQVVARQVLDDTPPEAWATVVRLRDQGFPRQAILDQLTLAVMHEIRRALEESEVNHEGAEGAPAAPAEPGNRRADHYRALLATLPVPDAADAAAALEAVVGAAPGIGWDGAVAGSLTRLDRAGQELARTMVDAAVERALDEGTLAILPPDRLVHPATLTTRIVLTHRLNAAELDLGALMCGGTDLAGFATRDELWWGGAGGAAGGAAGAPEIGVFSLEAGHVGWDGPDGWLDGFADGDLLAVRVDGDGVVLIERLGEEPPLDGALVERLRRVYDAATAESGLPAACSDLVFAILADEPGAFDRPQLPVTELCEHAGLELRGGFVADDDELWRAQLRLQRFQRVHEAFDDHDVVHEVLDVLDTAEDPDAEPDALRQALARLEEPLVCWGVLDELVERDSAGPDDAAIASDFAERLLPIARTPRERAVAHFVAGVVAERSGDARSADARFRQGLEADAGWGELVDRAAWYASLRGDARRAADLWGALEDADDVELTVVEEIAARERVKVGRNDPCWCGSGRKLKACHREPFAPVPLPERVPWMSAKAVGYLARHGGQARDDLFELALGLAAGPDVDDLADLDARSIAAAFTDPVVVDAALVELGWFERFVDSFGALLPADEAALLARWVGVDRTVYEVQGVRPAEGLVVRDLRSGETVDVHAPAMSATTGVGQHLCARAVPDGVTHQFVGAVLAVPGARASELLEVCDRGDAYGLCAAAASLERSVP